MSGNTYQLAYRDVDELIAEVGATRFSQGERITLRVGEGSDYTFTFMDSEGDHLIYGISAVREGVGVEVDLSAMTLTERG